MKAYILSLLLLLLLLFGSLSILAQSDYEIVDEQEVTSVVATFSEYDGENYIFETESGDENSTLYFANIEEDLLLDFDLNTEEFQDTKFEIEYITEEVVGDDGEIETTSKTIINLILK